MKHHRVVAMWLYDDVSYFRETLAVPSVKPFVDCVFYSHKYVVRDFFVINL